MDELRPLDPAAYNPFVEVWTRIARIPPAERYRLLDELEPGCLRSLWRASLGRYVLGEGQAAGLFAGAAVWDDLPVEPGEVYEYEGRCERYELGSAAVALEPYMDPRRAQLEGGPAASAAATPWLRPRLGSIELPVSRFDLSFFVPVGDGDEDEEDSGLAGSAAAEGAPVICSRIVLPLLGPLSRWWEPLYALVRVQLTLTPRPADAGADICLLYPDDADVVPPGFAAASTDPWATSSQEDPALGAGEQLPLSSGDVEDGDRMVWPLPPGREGTARLPSRLWPAPDPLTSSTSPFSGSGRDYLRVAGPGVYVGCGYREGPAPGEYREENCIYFVIVRKR